MGGGEYEKAWKDSKRGWKLIAGNAECVDKTFDSIVMWSEEEKFRALVVDANGARGIVGDDGGNLQDLADSRQRKASGVAFRRGPVEKPIAGAGVKVFAWHIVALTSRSLRFGRILIVAKMDRGVFETVKMWIVHSDLREVCVSRATERMR